MYFIYHWMIVFAVSSVGPDDDHGIYLCIAAQTDDLLVIHRGLKATAGDYFPTQYFGSFVNQYAAADAKSIFWATL